MGYFWDKWLYKDYDDFPKYDYIKIFLAATATAGIIALLFFLLFVAGIHKKINVFNWAKLVSTLRPLSFDEKTLKHLGTPDSKYESVKKSEAQEKKQDAQASRRRSRAGESRRRSRAGEALAPPPPPSRTDGMQQRYVDLLTTCCATRSTCQLKIAVDGIEAFLNSMMQYYKYNIVLITIDSTLLLRSKIRLALDTVTEKNKTGHRVHCYLKG